MRALCLQGSSIFESYGGIEYYLDDLLTLIANEYGADAVTTVVPQRLREKPLPRRPYGIIPVPFTAPTFARALENRYSPRMFQAARAAIAKSPPSVILCGHVNLGPLAMALSLATKIPYVTIVYGIEAWGNLLPQDELALKRARGVISISHWTKRVLVDRGYAAGRIAVVQPMLPAAYEKNLPPERTRGDRKEFRLLTVSRLSAQEAYKGQDHVIEALARVRNTEPGLDLRYRIQGDGTDRPRLEALVAEKALGDIVEFPGGVKDRTQLEEAYRWADLYIMPSRFGRWDRRWRGEGFGIVYLEAAAFGLASIAYDCGGATDVIRHGLSGMLLAPDDIGDLARQINNFGRRPQRAIDMGKKAYEIAMQEFSREAIGKQLRAALGAFQA